MYHAVSYVVGMRSILTLMRTFAGRVRSEDVRAGKWVSEDCERDPGPKTGAATPDSG